MRYKETELIELLEKMKEETPHYIKDKNGTLHDTSAIIDETIDVLHWVLSKTNKGE